MCLHVYWYPYVLPFTICAPSVIYTTGGSASMHEQLDSVTTEGASAAGAGNVVEEDVLCDVDVSLIDGKADVSSIDVEFHL